MNSGLQVMERNFFNRIDHHFVATIFTFNFVGLIFLYSATHGAQASGISSVFLKQIVFWIVGWSIFLVCTLFNYRHLRKVGIVFYTLNVLALIAVPFVGKTVLGAKRWIDLKVIQYQPSETMKIALLVMLAYILSKRAVKKGGMGLKELVLPIVVTVIPFVLVVKQPDLGTALILVAIAGSMILFVGVKRSILIGTIIAGIAALFLGWNYGMKPYQKQRVLTFLSPGADPRGTGYNSIQSKIAVGSGGVLGKGFMKGSQSQLEFLPERHTDFIYSVVSEEHGFLGSLIILLLFAYLYYCSIQIATRSQDPFGLLLTVGCISYVFWHMFINIGMVIGLLPIVGAPLPLLSYGGSSLMTTMLGLGLISSVNYRKYIF